MDWLELIIPIISGLAPCIVLVIKLIQYVQKAIKEKNWGQLLKLVMSYMEEAESKFPDGATRKEWVMAMVTDSAELVNYDIDLDVVSEMIDSLSSMAKTVNAPPAAEETPNEGSAAGTGVTGTTAVSSSPVTATA